MSINLFESKEPQWDMPEILRYAGVKYGKADEATKMLIDECISEVKEVVSYNLVYSRLPISRFLNKFDLGFTMCSSEKLAGHLKGCNEIIVFAATLGIGIDRLINKYSRISPAKAVVMQAVGAERIESLCNEFQAFTSMELASEGKRLRSRYSPGYGDFSLGVQVDLFNYLDCQMRIGLTLNDSLLMSPSKSVTAIIGIEQAEGTCSANSLEHDCSKCSLMDCKFRR